MLHIYSKAIELPCGRKTRYKVYLNQLNLPKVAEELHCLKSQPMFSEAFQPVWRKAFNFSTRISGFSM